MNGTRIYDWDGSSLLNEGEYAKHPDGYWFAECPGGYLANLKQHAIEEHPDGTISVKPSILVSNYRRDLWHGYLTNGIFTTV